MPIRYFPATPFLFGFVAGTLVAQASPVPAPWALTLGAAWLGLWAGALGLCPQGWFLRGWCPQGRWPPWTVRSAPSFAPSVDSPRASIPPTRPVWLPGALVFGGLAGLCLGWAVADEARHIDPRAVALMVATRDRPVEVVGEVVDGPEPAGRRRIYTLRLERVSLIETPPLKGGADRRMGTGNKRRGAADGATSRESLENDPQNASGSPIVPPEPASQRVFEGHGLLAKVSVPERLAGVSPGFRLRIQGRTASHRGPAWPGGIDLTSVDLRRDLVMRIYVHARHEATFQFLGPAPGIGAKLRQWLGSWKARATTGIRATLPPHEAAMALALTVGWRADLPPEVAEAFRQGGTAHLLAISGLHIGIMLMGAAWLLRATLGRIPALLRRWPWPHWRIPPLLILAWIFVALSGAGPAVIRAATMASIALIIAAFGGRGSAIYAWAWAYVAMAIGEPRMLAELGFQLSFAAVAGLLLLGPVWRSAVEPVDGDTDSGNDDRWLPGMTVPTANDPVPSPLSSADDERSPVSSPNILERAMAAVRRLVTAGTLSIMDGLGASLAAHAFTAPILAIHGAHSGALGPLTNLFMVPLYCGVVIPAHALAFQGFGLLGTGEWNVPAAVLAQWGASVAEWGIFLQAALLDGATEGWGMPFTLRGDAAVSALTTIALLIALAFVAQPHFRARLAVWSIVLTSVWILAMPGRGPQPPDLLVFDLGFSPAALLRHDDGTTVAFGLGRPRAEVDPVVSRAWAAQGITRVDRAILLDPLDGKANAALAAAVRKRRVVEAIRVRGFYRVAWPSIDENPLSPREPHALAAEATMPTSRTLCFADGRAGADLLDEPSPLGGCEVLLLSNPRAVEAWRRWTGARTVVLQTGRIPTTGDGDWNAKTQEAVLAVTAAETTWVTARDGPIRCIPIPTWHCAPWR